MPRRSLEFWFEFASTYSYPAAARIEAAAGKAGVRIAWRPFLLGPLFLHQQGMKDSPFNLVPAKGAYMWRDLQRICARDGIGFRRPSVFPRNSLSAARVAYAAAAQEWLPRYVRNVYAANFARNEDIADPTIIAACIRAAGGNPGAALAAAKTDEIKLGLRRATETAAAQGVFGSPSFVAEGGELFWGNDRLDDAIAWAAR